MSSGGGGSNTLSSNIGSRKKCIDSTGIVLLGFADVPPHKTLPRATVHTRVNPNVSGLSHNEINNNKNEHSLRSNTKGYGGKTH